MDRRMTFVFINMFGLRSCHMQVPPKRTTFFKSFPSCRLTDAEHRQLLRTILGTSHSFPQFHRNNITRWQLYVWGAPMNVAEDYEHYLMRKTHRSQTFQNCSVGFYGRGCQLQGISFTDTFTSILPTKNEYEDS